MSQNTKIEIVSIQKVLSINPDRLGKFDLVVVYKAGKSENMYFQVANDNLTRDQLMTLAKKDYESKTK